MFCNNPNFSRACIAAPFLAAFLFLALPLPTHSPSSPSFLVVNAGPTTRAPGRSTDARGAPRFGPAPDRARGGADIVALGAFPLPVYRQLLLIEIIIEEHEIASGELA